MSEEFGLVRYTLNESGQPVKVRSLALWCYIEETMYFQKHLRVTWVGKTWVLTRFEGVPYDMYGTPTLWVTYVDGDRKSPLYGDRSFYTSQKLAVVGHERVVAAVRHSQTWKAKLSAKVRGLLMSWLKKLSSYRRKKVKDEAGVEGKGNRNGR